MSLDTVAALVVRLMDLYNIRVGSDEYARANESYGSDHAQIDAR